MVQQDAKSPCCRHGPDVAAFSGRHIRKLGAEDDSLCRAAVSMGDRARHGALRVASAAIVPISRRGGFLRGVHSGLQGTRTPCIESVTREFHSPSTFSHSTVFRYAGPNESFVPMPGRLKPILGGLPWPLQYSDNVTWSSMLTRRLRQAPLRAEC